MRDISSSTLVGQEELKAKAHKGSQSLNTFRDVLLCVTIFCAYHDLGEEIEEWPVIEWISLTVSGGAGGESYHNSGGDSTFNVELNGSQIYFSHISLLLSSSLVVGWGWPLVRWKLAAGWIVQGGERSFRHWPLDNTFVLIQTELRDFVVGRRKWQIKEQKEKNGHCFVLLLLLFLQVIETDFPYPFRALL